MSQKRKNSVTFKSVDPESSEATVSMTAYFDELAERFPEGFDPGDTLTADASQFRLPNGRFFIGLIDDSIVCCGGVHLLEPDVAEVKRMWVAANARGQGLGAQMLTQLEQAASTLGATTVYLDTNSVLLEAITLYLSRGYLDIEAYNTNPYARRWFAKELGSSDPSSFDM